MSATGRSSIVSAPTRRLLPAELLDGITDAILSAPDQLSRNQVVADLVGEIYESVAWLHRDLNDAELISLRRVTGEVSAHCDRLAFQDDSELRLASRVPIEDARGLEPGTGGDAGSLMTSGQVRGRGRRLAS